MRKSLCIILICIMITAIFSGCSLLQKLGLVGGNDELHPVSSIVMSEDEAKKISDKVPIHIYFADESKTKLRLQIRYIPVSEAKKIVGSLASVIVKELIKGPGANTGLNTTIPAGTQLHSAVTVKAGVATVDFTREFVDKHPGGKTAEQLTIYSVVNSLTELKEVQKVRFLINGKTQKEYRGNFQFDTTFPRTASLILREPAASVPDAAKTGDSATKPAGSATKATDGKSAGDDQTKPTSGDAGDGSMDAESELLE